MLIKKLRTVKTLNTEQKDELDQHNSIYTIIFKEIECLTLRALMSSLIKMNLSDNFSEKWQKVLQLAEMAKLALLGCFAKGPFFSLFHSFEK